MKLEKKLKKLDSKINKVKLDIISLSKKGLDKDIVDLIKQKKQKLDLLKEEYNKMSKMEIVKGKLQKVDEPEEVQAPTEAELQEQRDVREVEMEAIEHAETQAMFGEKPTPVQEPMQQVPVQTQVQEFIEQAPVQEFIEQVPVQELMPQAPVQEQQFTQEQIEQLNRQQLARQEELLRAQALAEQQQQVLAEQQSNMGYRIKITYFPNVVTHVDVKQNDIETFINKINEAISSQIPIVFGGTTFNGRYIIKHELV